MTRRDMAWRGAGVALLAVTAWVGFGKPFGDDVLPALLTLLLAIVGLVLAVQGHRVPLAWRVERSSHRMLPQAIHQRRCRRTESGDS